MALSLVGISATKCGFALDGRGWGEGRRQKLFQLRVVILMIRYYVVGGEYKDTHFAEAIGGDEQWFGPFTDYEAAKKAWARHAWQTVDDCTTRSCFDCIYKYVLRSQESRGENASVK